MFDQRRYRLVFDFLSDLEAFIRAVREEDFGLAARLAEDDLFTQGSALYGEGFGPVLADELRRLGCDEAVASACPLVASSLFRALAVFAGAGKHGEMNDRADR